MPDYTYTALVHDDGRIEYAEHYEAETVARSRASQLESEATIRGEADGKWLVYLGAEPYEVMAARAATIREEGESDADYHDRVAMAELEAAEATVSVLTAPPVDDRPEWYKAGFPSQAAYDKAHPKEEDENA